MEECTKYENFISNNKVLSKINTIVNSYGFIFIIGLLVVLSSSFAIEVICFPLISLLGVISLLVSKDTKPVIPIVLTFLMGMSYKNGITYNPNPDLPNIYDNKAISIFFFCLMLVVILAAIINQFLFKQYKNSWKKTLIVLPAIIVLSIGYLLSGVTSGEYLKNFTYTVSNVAMILAIFIVFSQTAFRYQDKSPLNYLSQVMVMTSLLIGLEVICIYFTNDVIVNGEINKWEIKNGWGVHNNFAGYLALAYPFITYLVLKTQGKASIKYYLMLLLTIIFTLLTNSRNGILIIALETLVSIILIFKYKKVSKKNILIIVGSCLVVLLVFCGIFYKQIYNLFKIIIDSGFDLNKREELYMEAWNAFLRNPIFGSGWFIITTQGGTSATPFAPDFKVHNFVLQLLGSTGIFGFLCFCFLIFVLAYLTFKNTNTSKKVFSISILVLILTSVFDNFFFDYGFERYLAVILLGITLSSNKEDLPYQKLLNRIGAK